jgi:hypothetical protein
VEVNIVSPFRLVSRMKKPYFPNDFDLGLASISI